jgi:hypothetical protein
MCYGRLVYYSQDGKMHPVEGSAASSSKQKTSKKEKTQ